MFADSLDRIGYLTDASIYREIPFCVAYSENVGDIIDLIADVRCSKMCLIPSVADTSIAG